MLTSGRREGQIAWTNISHNFASYLEEDAVARETIRTPSPANSLLASDAEESIISTPHLSGLAALATVGRQENYDEGDGGGGGVGGGQGCCRCWRRPLVYPVLPELAATYRLFASVVRLFFLTHQHGEVNFSSLGCVGNNCTMAFLQFGVKLS